MKNYAALLVSTLFTAAAACSGQKTAPSPAPSSGGPRPAASATWLCRPDTGPDPCASSELTATEVGADGARGIFPHTRTTDPKAECFYVYPTVDLGLVPGNHEDLGDTTRILATTRAQAARFSQACRLWVPLYRQVTLGTWLQPRPELERHLAVAFADVERAFVEFLAAIPPARKIVLIGHSQGAEMTVRILRRFFDHDDAMRSRLLLAMPIGGEVEVPIGKTTGGTLDTIPICTRPLETGCVVAYRTHHAKDVVDPSRWAPRTGHETVCVDPSVLDLDEAARAAPHKLARAYYPVRGEHARFLRGVAEVTTPFVVLRDFYDASCVRGERGYAYLAVDARAEGPVDLGSRRFKLGKLGLHVLDLQLAQGDLVDLVARRVAKIP